MTKALTKKEKQYSKLISDLRKILEEGRECAVSSVNCSWEQLEQLKSCPAGQPGQLLSWSHYKTLLAIEDKSEREFYLKESFLNDWGRGDLMQKIRDNYAKAQNGAEAQNRKGRVERKTNKMYLYSAIVERVVDGDTLLLRVDLGFDVWINQRIRLRGIDCPEISTPEGKRAKEFVEEKLKGCLIPTLQNRDLQAADGVGRDSAPKGREEKEPRTSAQGGSIVVIQTFKKIDVYGRYVCDLFYLKDETDKELIAEEGGFLNQELLDAKLAVLL